eukprot:scaffold2323_cov329-Prasinococcus_capsulatus_cf.AAC.4
MAGREQAAWRGGQPEAGRTSWNPGSNTQHAPLLLVAHVASTAPAGGCLSCRKGRRCVETGEQSSTSGEGDWGWQPCQRAGGVRVGAVARLGWVTRRYRAAATGARGPLPSPASSSP